MRALLGKLDLETQQAAIHYFVDEMTLDEVAKALGRSVPTVRKRLESVAAMAGGSWKESRGDDGADMNMERSHRRARAAPPSRRRGAGPRGPAVEAHAGVVRRVPRAPQGARRRAAPLRAGDLVRPLRGGRRARVAPRAAPRPRAGAHVRSLASWSPTLALAAGVALFVTFRHHRRRRARRNRIKGGRRRTSPCASPRRRPAAHGARRRARGARGRRARAHRLPAGGHRYLLSLSIDEHGAGDAALPRVGPQRHRAGRRSRARRRATCPTASSSPTRAASGCS